MTSETKYSTEHSRTDVRRKERFDSFTKENGRNSDRPGDPKSFNGVNHDDPPFSRVFVVCCKHHTGDDLRECFEKFGIVEDVWVVKDKHTKENRGVAYVKFSKMSEATLAVQEMDGKPLAETDEKSLKVIIAQPKASKSTDDFSDETALTRLFVSLPKDVDEKELRLTFDAFGEIEYVQVVKDRKTGEKKGFGYIKYRKAHDAAKAVEGCERSYRAVMAEPKSTHQRKRENEQTVERSQHTLKELGLGLGLTVPHSTTNIGTRLTEMHSTGTPASVTAGIPEIFRNIAGFTSGQNGNVSTMMNGGLTLNTQATTAMNGMNGSSSSISNKLVVMVSPKVSQENIGRLFDLIPGMEFCDLKKNYTTGESRGIASVVYNSVSSAIYAKEKLHGFEYPLGCKINIQYSQDDNSSALMNGTTGLSTPGQRGVMVMPPTPNSTPGQDSKSQFDLSASVSISNMNLPPPAPLAGNSEECAERLFIVCVPQALPDPLLKDIFSRFGGLIDVYMLKGKNFGYAKYTSGESAKRAIDMVNGHEVGGIKMKVMPAEPPKSAESARKRPRT